MKVLLLGVGMQGKVALHDLLANPQVDQVIAADIDLEGLKSFPCATRQSKATFEP